MPYKNKEDRNAAAKRRNDALRELDPTAYSLKREKQLEAQRKSYEKNKEKYAADHAKWRAEHPGYFTKQNHINGRYKPWEEYKAELDEKRRKKNEYMTEWSKTEQGQRCRTMRSLKRKEDVYGLSIGQYEDMRLREDGKCAICKIEKPLYGQQRHRIDHCHKTGNVRQLLCSNCNPGLSMFGDSIDLLKEAIAYLEKHGSNG